VLARQAYVLARFQRRVEVRVMMAGLGEESDTEGVEIDEAGHEQSAAGQSARLYICNAKPCVLEPVALEQEIRRAFLGRSVRLHTVLPRLPTGRAAHHCHI
jgi:hypothetical protein